MSLFFISLSPGTFQALWLADTKTLPLSDGFNVETLPVSDGFNLETLPLSDGFNLETLHVSDGFKLETLPVSQHHVVPGFKNILIFEAEIGQKTDFHLFYGVEGTKSPHILKIFWLGLGPFNYLII